MKRADNHFFFCNLCAAQAGKVYGCYDHEFVTSEVNSDVHIWLKDSEKGWAYSGSFETDPWEDPYNTIGPS